METPSSPPLPACADTGLPDPIRERLETQLKSGGLDLPVLPEAAGRVMTATMDESCDARKLAMLVQRDASLAAHLLRLANSALYSPSVPIVTLPQAVSRLGMAKIREIALIISCESRVFRAGDRNEVVRAIFRHSLAAGSFAQEIARLRRWNVEEAFLCGLMHDVGKPVILQALADLSRELKLPLSMEAADAAMDAAHAEVGSRLVKEWKLPARLEETILWHHQPEAAPTCAQTAMMTRLADDLSHWALGTKGVSDATLRAHPMNEPLNIYPDELESLLARRDAVLAVVSSLTGGAR